MYCQNIILSFFLGAIFSENNAAPSEKIVGGWPAEPGEFPYQVSLRVNGRHFCGGAIISNLHILTAAHCVKDFVQSPFQRITVVTGSNKLAHGGQSHETRKIVYHPEYMDGPKYKWHNDIAIITLVSPIKFNSIQEPINLPSRNFKSGSPGIIAGWGLLDFSNFRTVPDDLQKLPTTVYESSICEKGYGEHIHREQICAIQGPGIGACSGDSGGPLVVNEEVVGLASWVVPCAKGFPDVYTNVFSYMDFIEENM